MTRKPFIILLLIVLSLLLAVSCSTKNSTAQAEETAVEAITTVTNDENVEVEAPTESSEIETEVSPSEQSVEEEYSFDRSLYPEPDTLAKKFSYAFAIYLVSNYGDQTATYYWMYKEQVFPELDDEYANIGIYDYYMGSLIYTVDEINQILAAYQDDYNQRLEAQAAENLKKAEEFLEYNKNDAGVITTESGLQYRILSLGSGETASVTDTVELDYELRTLGGTVIDSSYARGEHAVFGLQDVIEGFREGVSLMPMGSHFLFYIHPDLGYGEYATGGMEPNTLLIFEVETYSIVK